MAKRSRLRLGVSNDPNAPPPSLKDVLDAAVVQAEGLMQEVLDELVKDDRKRRVHRSVDIQHPLAAEAVQLLAQDKVDVAALFQKRLSDEFFLGGRGRGQAGRLRFDDLGLFGDEELSESVELARAQEEMLLAVDDVLPQLDAVMCTLMGWTTPQSGINPLRPEVYVRALHDTLTDAVAEAGVREALIVPAAGFMGVRLHDHYRELTDWLRSFGVEPAVPVGARLASAGGTPMSAMAGTVAKTLLTLDKLRHLLLGDLEIPSRAGNRPGGDFGLTIPASYEALQQLKQVDAVVERLERRTRSDAGKAAARAGPAAAGGDESARRSLGRQLGEEVVRLMFDNLAQDSRLLPALKDRLKTLEPQVLALAAADSRFFSDRKHAARQFLERITQRSLAYQTEADEGCARFLGTIDDVLGELSVRAAGAELFADMLGQLDEVWMRQDETARSRRADAAQALLHVEQRNLLAQRLAIGLGETLKDRDIAPFVGDFLRGPWSLVMAEARLTSADGASDTRGHEMVVEDLLWSVELRRARRNPRRLAAMIPGLLQRLREGLQSIEVSEEQAARFFEGLIALHARVLEQRRGAARDAAALQGQDSRSSELSALIGPDSRSGEMWVGSREAEESGFIPEDSAMLDTGSGEEEAGRSMLTEPVAASDMRLGSWIELRVQGIWVRAQLTWASPHGTLFMFTAASGAAHSMSRRTMERLLAQGGMRIVSEGRLVDQALDQVAKAALKNSMKDG